MRFFYIVGDFFSFTCSNTQNGSGRLIIPSPRCIMARAQQYFSKRGWGRMAPTLRLRILPHNLPIVRGVGQIARGDSALDAGLGLTGASDSSLKTLMARGEPADKLKPTSGGLDLNEVLSVKPHNKKIL